jgi:hypothetical protein
MVVNRLHRIKILNRQLITTPVKRVLEANQPRKAFSSVRVARQRGAQFEHRKAEHLQEVPTFPIRLISLRNCNNNFSLCLMLLLRILKASKLDTPPVGMMEVTKVLITRLSIRQHNVNANSTTQFKEKA